MTPPRFGVYNRFLVKWNYTPLFAGSPEAEYAITSQWLREASADPALRYSKQQFSEPLDPRSPPRIWATITSRLPNTASPI